MDQPLIDHLPHTVDYLCDECRTHFDAVQRYLGLYGIPYRLSHRLARGLDYYTRTTFEVLGHSLGAQNAILGGGRYDGLVKKLGGPDRVGIGFAAGFERLVLALPDSAGRVAGPPAAFVAAIGDAPRDAAFQLVRELRLTGIRADIDYDGRSLKGQMKRADRLAAPLVLILGDDELARGQVTVKDMRTHEQADVTRSRIVEFVRTRQKAL